MRIGGQSDEFVTRIRAIVFPPSPSSTQAGVSDWACKGAAGNASTHRMAMQSIAAWARTRGNFVIMQILSDKYSTEEVTILRIDSRGTALPCPYNRDATMLHSANLTKTIRVRTL
jgi:hypothetical protein